MKLPRRQFLHLAAGAVALQTVSRLACAQSSTRPVRLIVGITPGRRLLGRRQVCRSRPERTSWNRLARDGVSIN